MILQNYFEINVPTIDDTMGHQETLDIKFQKDTNFVIINGLYFRTKELIKVFETINQTQGKVK